MGHSAIKSGSPKPGFTKVRVSSSSSSFGAAVGTLVALFVGLFIGKKKLLPPGTFSWFPFIYRLPPSHLPFIDGHFFLF